MVDDNYSYSEAAPSIPEYTCPECGKKSGGETNIDTYKHMLHCLHVEPDSLERIRRSADAERTDHGDRVKATVDFLIGGS